MCDIADLQEVWCLLIIHFLDLSLYASLLAVPVNLHVDSRWCCCQELVL